MYSSGFGPKAFQATKHIEEERLESADGVDILLETLEKHFILDKLRNQINMLRKHALRKPDPGEPSSLENLEQTEILPEKVYQTENFPEQTEILTEQTEILVDQDT